MTKLPGVLQAIALQAAKGDSTAGEVESLAEKFLQRFTADLSELVAGDGALSALKVESGLALDKEFKAGIDANDFPHSEGTIEQVEAAVRDMSAALNSGLERIRGALEAAKLGIAQRDRLLTEEAERRREARVRTQEILGALARRIMAAESVGAIQEVLDETRKEYQGQGARLVEQGTVAVAVINRQYELVSEVVS